MPWNEANKGVAFLRFHLKPPQGVQRSIITTWQISRYNPLRQFPVNLIGVDYDLSRIVPVARKGITETVIEVSAIKED